MKYIGCFLLLFCAHTALGAISESQTKPKPQPPGKILEGEGAIFGGIAGNGFTLMDVRLTASKDKKVERIVIDVGDLQGAPMRGWPGYYFAEMKKNPQRLVIDFSQMPHAHLDQAKIAARMAASRGVLKTAMSLDPVDNSLNLTWDLKKNTKARVYQVFGKKTTSKVVVDLYTE